MIAIAILIVFILVIGGGIWVWPFMAGALGLSHVTDKSGALKYIAQLVNTYDISLDEVATALQPQTVNAEDSKNQKRDIGKTLFIYLGAIFIIAGIGTYIGMFWSSMGSAMRIFVSLGVGYILFVVLVSALHENKFPKLILPMTFASIFFMNGGWFVLIDELFPSGGGWRTPTLFVFGVMTIQLLVLFALYQRTVLLFFSLVYAYGFMQVGLDKLGVPINFIAIVLGASLFLVGVALNRGAHRVLVEPSLFIGLCWLNAGLFDRVALSASANWASFIIGISIMSAAYGLQKANQYQRLITIGYFTGSLLMYAGLFDLVENTSLEILYLAVTASILYACLVLQSRALLLTTVIAMLSFIGYYSAEYFSDSLGWPITLVLMGFCFLGVGAIAIRVKRRMQ